jgi:hypothetical protein
MARGESLLPTPVPLEDGDTTNIKTAAALANASPDSVARWCRRYGIGHQLEPKTPWRVSLPALRMVIACDTKALEAFRAGDRNSDLVRPYLDGIAA